MRSALRPEEINDILHFQPFVPLRVHLSNGKTCEIVPPEQMMVKRSRADIAIRETNGIAERTDFVSPLHIVLIEQLVDGMRKSSPSTGRN